MKNNNKKFTSCLFKVPIFSHLTEEEQKGIVKLVRVKKLKKGETLYNAGDHGSFLYVVHEGKVKISRYTEEGNEQVLRVLSTGDFAGEQALFTNNLASDFAITLEDSMVCVLDGAELKKHMLEKPEISVRIISELSKRLSESETKLESYNLDSVGKRVAQSIIKHSEGNDTFELPISKLDWASILGMSNETLSRKLSQFKKSGLIDLKGQREIIILDKDKLNEIS
ncbi:MAG TPA: Crp/Fnr family transcriptional regulator [Acholeplasma sp.]|nr:Crp/Fnr family transcriptional regulator [Acholeplasma sp.]